MMKKDRPIVELRKSKFDFILELLGVLFLIILIILPAWHYSSLPDTLPSHFNAKGEPDGFSGKWIIWLLPVIGTIMYLGFRKLARIPNTYNYPMKITKENAESAYQNGSRMITSMSVIILGAFSYINYSIIRSAQGGFEGLGKQFLPLFICILFGAIFYYTYKTISTK